MSKHTPGPWLTFGDTIVADDKLAPGYSLQICAVGSLNDNVRHERTELEANKNLIAAAPDLLAACESMLAALSSVPVNYTNPKMCLVDFERWKAAITKAEGRS